MKKTFILFVAIYAINIQAQKHRKIVPFEYQNKWGIVDSLANEIVKPIYKSVNIFNDFLYAEFDGKDLYNLQTGEKQKALGKYIATIGIKKDNYHLFSNDKKSYLVNFEKKETITLTTKYTRLDITQLYNNINKKTDVLIKGYLENNEVLILKNDKNLTPLIPHKFKNHEIDFIENEKSKIIGFVVKQENKYVFYNHNLKQIQTEKAPEKTGYYDLLTNEVEKKLPAIYQTETATPGCSSCESVWNNSWDLDLHKVGFSDKLPYYVARDGRKYVINNKTNTKYSLEIYPELFHYERTYKIINISKTNSSFFYDPEYIKTPRILFPEKYLNIKSK